MQAKAADMPMVEINLSQPLDGGDAWPDSPHHNTRMANLVCAATIEPKPIVWLWPTWIAAGKLTIVAGAAGTGKTTLCLGLVATLSCAGRWPDGQKCLEAGNTIIWSSEDDPQDTIIPRLVAMGADLTRIHIIQGRIDERGKKEPFDPATDMDLLRMAARRIGGVSLLMLDPVVSAVRGDMHKANEVRRSLQPVIDFAAEHGAAVIGISHFAKGSQGTTPQERVIGSQAFTALARMVLGAAKKEDSDLRILTRMKTNITVSDGGITYGIEPATLDNGIETTRVYWGGTVEGTARELLGEADGTNDDDSKSELADAADFLRSLLIDGPVSVKVIKAESNDAGYSWATIRRAQSVVGADSFREGEPGKRGGGAWYWRLRCSVGLEHLNREHLNKSPETRMNTGFAEVDEVDDGLRRSTLGSEHLNQKKVVSPSDPEVF